MLSYPILSFPTYSFCVPKKPSFANFNDMPSATSLPQTNPLLPHPRNLPLFPLPRALYTLPFFHNTHMWFYLPFLAPRYILFVLRGKTEDNIAVVSACLWYRL